MISPPRPDGPLCVSASPTRRSPGSRRHPGLLAVAEGLRAHRLFGAGSSPTASTTAWRCSRISVSSTSPTPRRPDPARYAERPRCSPTAWPRAAGELPFDDEPYALPVYDIDAMLIEVDSCSTGTRPHRARRRRPRGRACSSGDMARAARADPRGAADLDLRDFHSPNLHWLAERQGLETPRPHRLPGRGARARRPMTSPRCCRTRASMCPRHRVAADRALMRRRRGRDPASTPSASPPLMR